MRGLESLWDNSFSSLLTTSHFFSMRHGGKNHSSSCLFLQNLGKSRKCTPLTAIVFETAPDCSRCTSRCAEYCGAPGNPESVGCPRPDRLGRSRRHGAAYGGERTRTRKPRHCISAITY